MIKAVCFDLDGVYFTKEGMEKFIESLINRGVSEETARYAIFKSEEMKSFKRGEITESEFWNFCNKTFNLNLTIDDYEGMLVKYYQINEDVNRYIEDCRNKGIKTCICSNNFETRIRGLETKFDFVKNFDVCIFSYKVGILKPEPGIFKILLQELNLEGKEVIYSDDNEDKLQGALKNGINAFVYGSWENFKSKVDSLAIDNL